MRKSEQYFVRSFPSGPSTTEKAEASGEDDLMMETLNCRRDGKGVKLDRTNHLGGPIHHFGWIMVGYIVGLQALT